MRNEADTRAELIDPKLIASKWKGERIKREVFITAGKIINEYGKRQKRKRADYILYYESSLPIAVVEAKEEGASELDGMGQAKEYAKMIGCLFAYSTNGRKIEEFDFITNTQQTIEKVPTPEELFKRYMEFTFKQDKDIKPLTYEFYTKHGKIPRYYQEKAIKQVLEAIIKGDKRILLTMATGTGKTFTAFQIVWLLLKSNYFKKVLYLADRNFLRNQAYNEYSPFDEARQLIPDDKPSKSRKVYFSIYQALYSGDERKRTYQDYPPDFFDLIIIDECHRSGYGTWKEILDYFSGAVQLGMTATPKRSDNIDTYQYFGEPVYSYSMADGIEDGFLAPYQIYRIFTNVGRDGLNIREALHQGAQIYIPEDVELKDNYLLESFEREIALPDRTKEICEHLAKQFENFGPEQKTIIFCVDTEHAALVAKELQNHFAHLGYSDYAVRIVAIESNVEEMFEKFKDSEKVSPVIATTVDLLTTGIDVPSIRNLVFLRPISSKVYFKQHLGRGCRIDDTTGKYFFRVIDYVNATRLLDEWDYASSGEPERLVEGPFNLSLEGHIVHSETYEPVIGAGVKAQLGPNMQRNGRSDENGFFRLEQLAHSPITLTITKGNYRSRELTITPTEDMEPILIELRPQRPVKEKIVVEGVEVYIAEETNIFIASTGKTLTDAEYKEYSRKGITQRVTSLETLNKVWLDRKKREEFLEDLGKESIHPQLLAGILQTPDADAFDAIAHIAFGAPMLTRDERARAFLNKKKQVFDALGSGAQLILLSLLEKYRAGGINQVVRSEVFDVPPFDKMGRLQGVIDEFGGIENLKESIDMIEQGLYESTGVE